MESQPTLEKIISGKLIRYDRLRDIIYSDLYELNSPFKRNQSGVSADICFEITTQCNWECRNCFSESSFRYKGLSTTADSILRSIEERQNALLRVNISGGEPFLHTEIDDILQFPRRFKDIGFVVTTNGSFQGTHIDLLKENGWLVTISLHGHKTAHDLYTNRKSFARVIESIEFLRRAEIPFHIYSVLNDQMTEHDLIWLSDFSRDSGAEFWRMIEPRPFGRYVGLSKPNLLLTAKEMCGDRAGIVYESSYSHFQTVTGQVRQTN